MKHEPNRKGMAGLPARRAPGPAPLPISAPIQKPKRVRRRLPDFLRPAEADALLGATPSRRDRLIVLLGLYAGLRVSEIVKLRVEDVDQTEGTLFVRQGKGNKDRLTPAPDALLAALRDWAGGRKTGWLFPSPRKEDRPLTTRAVGYLVARLKEASGIVRPCHPHTLRHTYATLLLRSGADIGEVSSLLGHSSIKVTIQYLHLDPSGLKGVVNRLSFGEQPPDKAA